MVGSAGAFALAGCRHFSGDLLDRHRGTSFLQTQDIVKHRVLLFRSAPFIQYTIKAAPVQIFSAGAVDELGTVPASATAGFHVFTVAG